MSSEQNTPRVESQRLEALWSGEFGDAYVERNRSAGAVRAPFWNAILDRYPARHALEVGCNVGANLRWIASRLGSDKTWGVDINHKAICELRELIPGIGAILSPARQLPFRDRWFDLTFTMGVLIHQPDETLPLVMSEIVRTSRRYVLCGEYFAEAAVEVPYRGHSGALFKRDYGTLYQSLFPELALLEQGFLGRDQGWDDVTYWVFERHDP
jgi:spore coat polysaccharide biosynthesis protein SpsF